MTRDELEQDHARLTRLCIELGEKAEKEVARLASLLLRVDADTHAGELDCCDEVRAEAERIRGVR